MSSYRKTTVDVLEINPVTPNGLPLAVDDYTLAMQLGIRCRTLWWMLVALNAKDVKPGFCQRIEIQKKSGGIRVVYNLHPRFKAIQRAVTKTFLAPIPLGEHVGAYRPGRSYSDTARRHEGHSTVLEFDVKNFFDRHKRSWVRKYFQELGYSRMVANLLASLLTVRAAPNENRFITGQGLPSSPAICNLLANRLLDVPLLEQLPEGWVYSRYSDNLFISHPERQTRASAFEVVKIVKTQAAWVGYPLHAEPNLTFANHLSWAPKELSVMDIREPRGYTIPTEEQQLAAAEVVKLRLDNTQPVLSVMRSRGHYVASWKEPAEYFAVVNKTDPRLTDDVLCNVARGSAQTVLGLTVNSRAAIPRLEIRKLKSILHNCMLEGISARQISRAGKETPQEFLAWITGKVNWVKTVNEAQWVKLAPMLEKIKPHKPEDALSAAPMPT